jgi:hypothetical protein
MAFESISGAMNQREPFHTTSFESDKKRTRWINQNKGLLEVGYTTPDGQAVPEEYLVKITSYRNKCTIISPIQEPIQTRVESRWEPFVPTSMLNQTNVYFQLLSGGKTSLITKASSRRLWQGSTPMSLSVNLKFEAVSDPFIEVIEPCRLLQSIALPSDPSSGAGATPQDMLTAVFNTAVSGDFGALSKLPLLSPPGPTPFSTEGILNLGSNSYTNQSARQQEIMEGLKGGDIIMVEFGKFMLFYNVIVKSVSVTVPPKFDPSGQPVSAQAQMEFETYEMTTVEELGKMYSAGNM